VPNDAFDSLFDAWGQALNVNPQITKTIFHIESSGGKNTGRSLPDDADSPVGPMQMRPSTAAALAKRIGIEGPLNLQDMRFAVPLATAYVAEGLNATQSAEGAFGYYFAGPDRSKWGPKTAAYAQHGVALYPSMALKVPAPAESKPAQLASADTAQDQP